jgi:formate-dependent nitrite reductase membrane component NrfD
VALLALVWTTGALSWRPPSSRWAVPQAWARFGHAAYAGLFGLILGLGVLTAAASTGLYAMMAYAWAAPAWWSPWIVFLCFGICRSLPVPLLAMIVRRRGQHPHELLEALSKVAASIRPVEAALLAAIGVGFILGGGT